MPRKPREESPGAIHHVVAKGNAGERLVCDDGDRGSLIGYLERSVTRYRWSCLAYCLLDTHIHLVVRTPEPNLGSGMKSFEAPYAQGFNHRYERQGHLFRGRFYSTRLKTDDHLISAIIYVSLNPVRAGIVEQPELWRWSSYAATVGLVPALPYLDVTAALELIDTDTRTARLRLEAGIKDARYRDLLGFRP